MDDGAPQYSDAVLQAVQAGRKVDAIKLLREERGLGLKEAKHEIDRLARTLGPGDAGMPELAEEGGSGAVIKIVILIVVVLAIYQFFFSD